MTESDIQILVGDFENQYNVGDFEEQCIVCHEINSNDNKLCSLIDLIKYKKCSCDPLVHKACLEQWLFHKQRCLICNEPVEKKKLNVDGALRLTIVGNYCNIVCCIGIFMVLISVAIIVYECSVFI